MIPAHSFRQGIGVGIGRIRKRPRKRREELPLPFPSRNEQRETAGSRTSLTLGECKRKHNNCTVSFDRESLVHKIAAQNCSVTLPGTGGGPVWSGVFVRWRLHAWAWLALPPRRGVVRAHMHTGRSTRPPGYRVDRIRFLSGWAGPRKATETHATDFHLTYERRRQAINPK